jgi:hypothetical protein
MKKIKNHKKIIKKHVKQKIKKNYKKILQSTKVLNITKIQMKEN